MQQGESPWSKFIQGAPIPGTGTVHDLSNKLEQINKKKVFILPLWHGRKLYPQSPT